MPNNLGLLGFSILMPLLAMAAPPAASAQMIDFRTDSKGKQIMCVKSGLQGFFQPCGAENFHELVLTGTILSITPVKDGESSLTIRPDEVFWGTPPATLSALTHERDCMPELQVGDQWLFNLYRSNESNSLILEYGHESLPVAQAAEIVARLRRLQTMSDSGLIRGWLFLDDLNGNDEGPMRPANHKVVARRKSDSKEYTAFSDAQGNFEFEPLPVGKYEVSANTDPSLWAEENNFEVKPHSCTAFGFHLMVDGQISGKLIDPAGNPLAEIRVKAVNVTQEGYLPSTRTDDKGNFTLHGIPPGDYVLQVTLQSEPYEQAKVWDVFFPGVLDKSKAQVFRVQLGQIVRLPDLPQSERMSLPSPTPIP